MATARQPRRLDDLITVGRGRVRTAPLDVTDDAQVVAAVERTIAGFGRIDVLVNNAGHGSATKRSPASRHSSFTEPASMSQMMCPDPGFALS